MNTDMQLDLWRIGAAFIFVLILLIVLKVKGINREKEVIIASVRMTVQLILAGFLLKYLLQNAHPALTILVIGVMEIFAIRTIYKRIKKPISTKLKRIIALSMVFGSVSSMFFFILVVINAEPWYDPSSFIPIAGMLIGNSMTGINLGVSKLVDGMYNKRNLVESALMLGATPRLASKDIVDSAFDSAILPTINSMTGMGIVFLPGMMTGQILSGVSPIVATQYQIAIMLGIMGSVTLCVLLFVELGYRTFFNEDSQFLISHIDNK